MHDETGEAIAEALADNVTLLSMNVRRLRKNGPLRLLGQKSSRGRGSTYPYAAGSY